MTEKKNEFASAVSSALVTPFTDFYEKIAGTETVDVVKSSITSKAPLDVLKTLDPHKVINDTLPILDIPDDIDELVDYYASFKNIKGPEVVEILEAAGRSQGISENLLDTFSVMYHGIVNGNAKETLIGVAGNTINNFASAGYLPGLSKLAAIVGSDTVNAIAPNAVTTTLKHFNLDDISRDEVMVDYNKYAEETFLPTLDSIDRQWDSLEGLCAEVKDLDAFIKLTTDSKWLLSHDTRRQGLVSAGEALESLGGIQRRGIELFVEWGLL